MRHSPDGGDADDGLTGEVILEAEATEEEVAGVEAELRDVGIDWPVLAALERRAVGDYPWVIMLAAAPDAIFAIFTKKFAELAAEDAYKAVKSWVQRLASRRRDREGTTRSMTQTAAPSSSSIRSFRMRHIANCKMWIPRGTAASSAI